MFWHNFKYSFKTLCRSRMLLFWTFIFPILLGLFFSMAFSDIEDNEKLDIIDIAIVPNDSDSSFAFFKDAFDTLGDEDSENRMFSVTYTTLENAKELLDDDEITGYLLFDNDVSITVQSSGINETILKYVVDELSSQKKIVSDLMEDAVAKEYLSGNRDIDYEKIYAGVSALIASSDVSFRDISLGNLSYTMIEYYTLIAMACLYGGILSMFIVNYKLANMNSVGKRTAVSPVFKGRLIVSSLLASYVVQLFGIFLLLLFTIFVLHVDYGKHLLLMVLLACCGSFAGLSLGVAVAVLVKRDENTKTGILIAITMAGCFLSGMMGITMKYIVDTNVPILNLINPASMITDGFYALYYYQTFDRFIFDIVSLVVFSFVLILISIHGLRRQRYDSI